MTVYVVYNILEIYDFGGKHPTYTETEILGAYSTEENAKEAIEKLKETVDFRSKDYRYVVDYVDLQLDKPIINS